VGFQLVLIFVWLSLDPHNMGKRNNPLYCGKIERVPGPAAEYAVILPDRSRIMRVVVTTAPTLGSDAGPAMVDKVLEVCLSVLFFFFQLCAESV
jgi:hypothetical protein